MIDFACKRFKLDEVIRCGLGITKADYDVMKMMLRKNNAWLSTHELLQQSQFNLSTIQRAVKKLHDKGIIERRQDNLEGGGYVYLYKVRSKKEIKEIVMNIVNNWAKTVQSAFDRW